MPTMEDVGGAQEAFHADLEALGYRLLEQRRTGERHYALTVSRYLSYSVHWDPAVRRATFTWEHAIGEFMGDRGMQVGSNEPLNSFLYPQHDAQGPEDVAFVVGEMDRIEAILRSLDLAAPDA